MDIENKYGTYEMQKKLLLLLKDFHEFCVKNDIRYSLDWGSLLGAIRHQGFIPWDDDLDIMVDRENYMKLKKSIGNNAELSFDITSPSAFWIPRVRLAHDDCELNYPPTIDVLIMDNAPDGALARFLRVSVIKLLQGMLKTKPHFRHGNCVARIIARVIHWIGLLFGRERKRKWYCWISQKSNGKVTREITSYNEEYSCLGKYYPNDLMNEMILVPFEDMEAYVVKDYHRCLVTQFGDDYMTPIKTRDNHMEMFK